MKNKIKKFMNPYNLKWIDIAMFACRLTWIVFCVYLAGELVKRNEMGYFYVLVLFILWSNKK